MRGYTLTYDSHSGLDTGISLGKHTFRQAREMTASEEKMLQVVKVTVCNKKIHPSCVIA